MNKRPSEDRATKEQTVEEKWETLARANNYRCSMCGMAPPRSERGVFFARDLCAWCATVIDRDDLAQASPGPR